ncbi:hypothetical protein DEU32_11411 [Curtobacterium sp. AG1037]|uniref:hypothetical protein n=1 Tax=Curtobacterium sp. AG1037 TaxID=2183990 RepID=UPI000E0AB3F7|nr:hypothetical protein [Curtobacterium sp. AG1037]RDH95046.1 hypothetical protein DEU32_11411 [Curtobacterium sp. AG1037]
MHHDPVDEAALQWLTVDELAARRRDLVRQFDRLIRHPDSDAADQLRVLEEAATIDRVQRDRRRD